MRHRPSTTIIFLLVIALGVGLASLFVWSLDNRRPVPQYDPSAQGGDSTAPK